MLLTPLTESTVQRIEKLCVVSNFPELAALMKLVTHLTSKERIYYNLSLQLKHLDLSVLLIDSESPMCSNKICPFLCAFVWFLSTWLLSSPVLLQHLVFCFFLHLLTSNSSLTPAEFTKNCRKAAVSTFPNSILLCLFSFR